MPQVVTLKAPGIDLRLHIHGEQDQHVSRRLRAEGIWEPYETSLVSQFLEPGDTFIDVGANIGYFSLIAAQLVGENGQVFAFEPCPENMRLLKASLELNSLLQQVVAVQAGLAEHSDNAILFLSEDNLGDHQIFAVNGDRNSVPIQLFNGSEFLRDKLQQISLIKIDTQGSEFGVVKGLMPLLQQLQTLPRFIVELSPLSLRQCGSSGRALIELLATLALPFWIIDHIEHRLVLSDAEALATWCDNVDAVPGDEGFMNILLGPGLVDGACTP